jgi:cytochrome c556
VEIDAAKEDFKHLHRERGQLTRERDAQQQEIEIWSARCRELQMLKFGREIDLDELEANSDRSKEKEAEEVLLTDGEKFKAKSQKLFAVSAKLQEQLAEVNGNCSFNIIRHGFIVLF